MKKNRKFMSILLALSVAIAGCPAAYTAADTKTQAITDENLMTRISTVRQEGKNPDHVEQ